MGGGFLAGKSSRVQQGGRKRVCGYSYQVPSPLLRKTRNQEDGAVFSLSTPPRPLVWPNSTKEVTGPQCHAQVTSEWDSKVATSNPSFLSTNGSMGLGRWHSVHT